MDTKQITYSVTFVFRRGLQADLLAANEVPYDGEPIIETDTLKIKIGDGITPYSELNYVCANDLEILQEQLDAFFANADVSDKAIDTLLEIQKILNDSSIDIQGLLNKVNEFEALHKEIVNTHNTDKATLEAQIDELVNACDEAFNEAEVDRTEIRKEFAAADQEIALASTNAINALSGELAEVSATQILNNANVNERIDRVEEDYKAADEAIIDAYTKAIEDLTKIHNENKNNLQEADNQLDSKITTLDNEIKDLTTTIENEIENAKLDRTVIRNEIVEEKADLIKRSQEDHNAMREDIDEIAAGLDKKIDETKTAAENALNEEIENRTSAIKNLEDKHSQDINEIDETINAMEIAIGSEINDLSDDLDIEIERAKTAENTNDLAIKAEVVRATEAEKNITDSHVADMEALRKEIQEANTAISNTHAEDIAAVSSEAANDRAKIREELANAKNETQAYADAIKTSILGSDKLNETYDTLTEIAAWIEEHGVEATDLASAIAAEALTRDAKDVELTNAIEAEKTARESKDIIIETAIANEITNRQNKETEIEKAISDEASARSTETAKLTSDLATESNRAIQKETEIEGRLADLNNATTTKFTSLDEQLVEMNGKINSLPANEFEVVKTDLAAHKEEATNEFSTIRNELESHKNENNNQFQEAADDRAAIRSEIANASSAAQEDRALIRSQYAEADNILSTTCAAENAAIRAEFAAEDLKLTNSLNEEIARATAAEADTLAQSKAYTDSVKTAILGSEQLESTFNTLTSIAAWIEGDGVNATELTEAIAVETQNRATEDAAIRQSITDLNTTINTAINDLDIAHKAEIKSTNDTVAALGTELRGVDSNINIRLDAAITAHEAEDARIDAAYKAADAALEEALKNYFDTELGVIANGQY